MVDLGRSTPKRTGVAIAGLVTLTLAAAGLGYSLSTEWLSIGGVAAVLAVIGAALFASVGLEAVEERVRPATVSNLNRARVISAEPELAGLLQRCCQHKLPALLLLPSAGINGQGRFSRADADSIQFEFFDRKFFSALPLTTACVSFFTDGRGHVFLTALRAINAGPVVPHLVLRRPKEVIRSGRAPGLKDRVAVDEQISG